MNWRKACESQADTAVNLAYDWLKEIPTNQLGRQGDILKTAVDLKGINKKIQILRFQKLITFLRSRQWQEADHETYQLMNRTLGKEPGNSFTSNELLNFPCNELRVIDKLWHEHSNGRFGFSVQKEIYATCSAKLDGEYPGDRIWNKFCDTVGWRIKGKYIGYHEVTFHPSARRGHLPVLSRRGRGSALGSMEVIRSIVSRLDQCKLANQSQSDLQKTNSGGRK